MEKLRIAIIGAGAHARDQHYPALSRAAEIDLVAACDLLPEKVEEVRRFYAIPAAYTDYREMIEKERPDGVVIVLAPMALTPVALDCLDLGCHLMIEKPPGCTFAEARQILKRAEANGRKVMVSMNRRFMPVVRALRATARDRGLVYCAATYNKDGFVGRKWTWPSSLPVADSIHLVDLMRFVGGEVAEVRALAARQDAEFGNSHGALLRFESGAMGTVHTHHCVGARVHRFEIHARGLSAYLDVGDTHSPSGEVWVDGASVGLPVSEECPPEGVGIENALETRHFARYLAGEEEGESELADVIESVRLAEAIAAGYEGPLATRP